MRSIIVLRDVSKVYRMGMSSVYALRNVCLEIGEGEFVSVVGPSGSGKTTLLNIIGGIDRPTSGSVVVDDRPISEMDDNDLTMYRRRYVGFVFQFFNLIPSLTALENVEIAAELVDEPLDPREVLRDVGLGGRFDYFPGELSGGEQQRVAIARALVKNPPILLCDEPTGELDFETGRKILSLLRRINERYNKTVVLVTHNTPISRMSDRVVRLRSGEVIEDIVVDEPIDPLSITW
jgi:putative ABC transport system ATP-binding protein